MLARRPGGEDMTSWIGAYFVTTDPATENMITSRKYKMAGPFTKQVHSSGTAVMTGVLKWKGAMKIRDGDDIIASILQNSGAARDFQAQIFTTFKHR